MKKKKNQSQEEQDYWQTNDQENLDEEKSITVKKPSYPRYDLSKTYLRNKKAIAAARDLFFKNYAFEYIFLETEIPVIIYKRLAKNWEREKKSIEKKLLQDIRGESCADRCKEFLDLGLEVGARFLRQLISRQGEMSVKDFKLAMDAVQGVHRMKQLEEGKATDITAYENFTPDQLKVYIMNVQNEINQKHGDIFMLPVDGQDYDKEAALIDLKRGITGEPEQ